MNSKIAINIRVQLYNYTELMQSLRRLYFSMFYKKKNMRFISTYILFENYYKRVMGIIEIINLNYKNQKELYSIGYQNIDDCNILLRGTIESLIILNILLNQNSVYSENYFLQNETDKKEVEKFFKKEGKQIEVSGEVKTTKYDRYKWLRPLINKKIITLSDLLDFTDFTNIQKAFYENDINFNNNLSHPRLRNDSVIIDQLFGTGNVNDIMNIFEIIDRTINDLAHVLLVYDYNYYDKNFKANIINLFAMDINIREFSRELTVGDCKILFPLSELTKKHNKLRKQEFDASITHVDNLSFWMLVYSIGIGAYTKTSPNERLGRCLDKYFETLSWNIKELALSYEKLKPYIFFTKSRFLLEMFSIIDLLLNMSEKEVEVYQAHTDIRTFLDFCRIPSICKEDYISAGLLSRDYINTEIKYKDGKSSLQDIYIDNLNFIQVFYKDKYNIDVTKGKIKHVNGWAIKKIKNKINPPSNEKLILDFAKLIDSHKNDDINYIKLAKGIYILVCSYCHSTSYSYLDSLSSEVKSKMRQTYKYIIISLSYLSKRIEDKFNFISKYKNELKKDSKYDEKYTLDFSIKELLNSL